MAAENKARRGRRLPKALDAPSPVVVVYFVKKHVKGLSMLRSMTTCLFLLGFSAAAFGAGGPNLGDMDPYLWLSDIHGAKAASWAKAQTDRSNALLKADPTYRIAY